MNEQMKSVMTWPYVLRQSHSNNPAEGACAMDAINWLVHGKHGDVPICACPIISLYVIFGNDTMPDDIRQRLLAYLSRIAGSRSEQHKRARLNILMVNVIQDYLPYMLELADFPKSAEWLRSIKNDALFYENAEKEIIHIKSNLNVCQVGDIMLIDRLINILEKTHDMILYRVNNSCRTLSRLANYAIFYSYPIKDLNFWEIYFKILDNMLAAGPQGTPWSADVVDIGVKAYVNAGGIGNLVSSLEKV